MGTNCFKYVRGHFRSVSFSREGQDYLQFASMSGSSTSSDNTGQADKPKDFVKTYGQEDKNEDYGFYFFPGREKGKVAPDNTAWFGNWKDVFFKFRKDKTIRCMYNKQRCIQSSKFICYDQCKI